MSPESQPSSPHSVPHATDKTDTRLSHREHPAEEVYVTGTFDSWTKSVQLEKKGDVFEKTVDLKDASSKIYYKVRSLA